jgi:hypothetical protein
MVRTTMIGFLVSSVRRRGLAGSSSSSAAVEKKCRSLLYGREEALQLLLMIVWAAWGRRWMDAPDICLVAAWPRRRIFDAIVV